MHERARIPVAASGTGAKLCSFAAHCRSRHASQAKKVCIQVDMSNLARSQRHAR